MSIIVRYQQLLQEIKRCAQQAKRHPQDIQLLAVSKKQPISAIKTLCEQKQADFAESYLQEALPKIKALTHYPIHWHFIGQIQSNKTRAIAEHFSWVHSLDRLDIAHRLNRQRPTDLPPINVCLQINLHHEPQKSGFAIESCTQFALEVAQLPHLKLRGLMILPPKNDPYIKETFQKMYDFFQELQSSVPIDTLSMGMSGDFCQAIQAGSHIVRIGEKLFGPRA